MRYQLAIIFVLIALFGCGGGDGFSGDPFGVKTRAVPPGGTYSSQQNVKLEVYYRGSGGPAPIYYTTDGSNPTASSPVYTELIPISKNTTLKFFGTVMGPNGLHQEPVNTEIYVMSP